ncbi:uncharacterized protein PAC_01642 [Phialocephala subalpina]|uniref:Uncharacterized protein n=1 Tax=Phialocephala subalpina TaxID=576137 RepID=A0A1L7WG59_9HELO|nr:uncharacterized protein PAC_01642 [Phialocephala subalpina]
MNAASFAAQPNLPKLLARVIFPMSGEQDCSDLFHLLYEAVIGKGKECVSIVIKSFDEIMLETPIDCVHLLQQTWRSESSKKYNEDVIFDEHEDVEGHSMKYKHQIEELLYSLRSKQQRGRKITRSELEVSILEGNVLNAYQLLSPLATASNTELHSNADAATLYNCTLIFCLYITWTYGGSATNLLNPDSPALFDAIKGGHYPAVDLLIRQNAGVSYCDHDQTTTLHVAAQSGNSEIVKQVLKQNKIDVNAENERGLTPLHFACMPLTSCETSAILELGIPWISRARVIKLLLDAGAEARARDQQGNTPFQTLARIYVPEWKEIPKDSELNWREQDLNECIDLLLTDIRDLIEWDSHGTTPLHYASYLWPVSAIRKLLNFLDEHYLAPSFLDYAGLSPLHYAAVRGFEFPEEVVRLLAQAGIEARLRDVYGDTALTVARRAGQLKVVKELESIHQALNDEVRSRKLYQSWLSGTKSPFQVRQLYSPLNQPFPSTFNLMMKPRFMQVHGATEVYAEYPSTEVRFPNFIPQSYKNHTRIILMRNPKYINRLSQAYMLSWDSNSTLNLTPTPNCVPDPIKVFLASPIAIQLSFSHLSINLDPFAGVGHIPIRRPVAPGRIQYLKSVNRNKSDFQASLKQELQGSSPLTRKNSGGLLSGPDLPHEEIDHGSTSRERERDLDDTEYENRRSYYPEGHPSHFSGTDDS